MIDENVVRFAVGGWQVWLTDGDWLLLVDGNTTQMVGLR
jgi:hypothetical protein